MEQLVVMVADIDDSQILLDDDLLTMLSLKRGSNVSVVHLMVLMFLQII